MSRKKLIFVSAIIALLLASSFLVGAFYFPQRGGLGFYEAPKPVERATPIPAPTPAPKAPEERMVVYKAYISLETGDIQGALNKVGALAERLGGYVAGSSRSTQGARARAEVTIRVPKENFRAAVSEIETYGKLLNERTSSEDVTEEYVDLKARLENLKRQEERLREILDMAKTVEEVLEVERELERVRGRIESLQGRINYLERSVAMSVITVSLIEPPPPFAPPGMDWGETFETALRGFFAVLRGLIILALSLLPIAAVGIPAYWAYKKRRKARGEQAG